MHETSSSGRDDARQERLVDLLDRLLHHGVVAEADVSVGIADTELIRVSLRAVAATAFKLSARVGELEEPEARSTYEGATNAPERLEDTTTPGSRLSP